MTAPRSVAAVEPVDLAAVLAELHALRADVGELRSEVARLRVPRLAAADYRALARLLPAIRAAVAGRVFSVGDLAAHARLPTPEAYALREALGTLDAGATKRLGKLFARALGVHVRGLLVQHVGADRGAAVWSVAVAFPTEKPAALRDAAASAWSNEDVQQTHFHERIKNGD